MVLWFAGLSPLLVWLVFRSPALDYRMVIAGSLLPLVDAVTGRVWVFHTLVGSVALLAAVMLTTRRRRLVRRRWLAIPVGTFVHLVLDGMWTRTHDFWWPFFGLEFDRGLPEADRPVGFMVFMEVVGVLALVWCWRRFDLGDPANRERFLRTGQLPREVAGDGPARPC